MEVVARNLLRYLGDRGLIDPGAVVDGGVTVSAARSRNRFLKVKQKGGPSYFIKQALPSEPISAQTLAREAEIYRMAAGGRCHPALSALLPQFCFHDSNLSILALHHVEGAENLAGVHRKLGHCPGDLGRRLGVAVAACHDAPLGELEKRPEMFARIVPWVLDLSPTLETAYLRRSPASSRMIDLLLATPGLQEKLGRLRRNWAADTLIHTDLRWDNCLLAPSSIPREQRQLYIVDWELADIGDAAWDVGSLLHSYLLFWIASLPLACDPETMVEGATRPLEDVRPGAKALWEAYSEASRACEADPRIFLERAMGMMAARLLVTALELCVWSAAIDGRAFLIVQTALNVLDRPLDAARDLLGVAVPAVRPMAGRQARANVRPAGSARGPG